MRNAQLLQGYEPLHKALVTALESLCTKTAIVGGYPIAKYPEVGLGKWGRDCRSMMVCDVLADGSEYQVDR